MKVRAGYLLVLAALSLTACSKKEGSGGDKRMDVTRFQVEALSDETEITNSDYAARVKALSGKSKACRTSEFGSLAKGDRFVENFRAGTMKNGQVNTVDLTVNTQLVSLGKDAMFSSTIESVKASDANLEALMKRENKFNTKCKAGKKCVVAKTAWGNELEKFMNSYTDCKYNNEREVTAKYATGNYLLQDGRKVPVLVSRTQATYDRVCAQGSDVVILSTVKLQTDRLKKPHGKQCADSEKVMPYEYYLVQKTNSELIMEGNTRTLLAPAK